LPLRSTNLTVVPTARLSQGVSIVLCAPDDRSCPHRRGLEVGFRRFVGEFLFSVAQNTNYNPFNLFYQEIPELNLRVKRGLAGAAPAEEARASTRRRGAFARLECRPHSISANCSALDPARCRSCESPHWRTSARRARRPRGSSAPAGARPFARAKTNKLLLVFMKVLIINALVNCCARRACTVY
jgi:hypothetical protein